MTESSPEKDAEAAEGVEENDAGGQNSNVGGGYGGPGPETEKAGGESEQPPGNNSEQ